MGKFSLAFVKFGGGCGEFCMETGPEGREEGRVPKLCFGTSESGPKASQGWGYCGVFLSLGVFKVNVVSTETGPERQGSDFSIDGSKERSRILTDP